MVALETLLFSGGAFILGWIFGNTPYGRIVNAQLLQKDEASLVVTAKRLKRNGASAESVDEVLAVAVPKSSEKRSQAESPTANSAVRKLATAEEYREKATQHESRSRGYFADARKSKNCLNEKTTSDLIERGAKEVALMTHCNLAAATIYFKHNNPTYRIGVSSDRVDLHGLQEKEAIQFADAVMQNEMTVLRDTSDRPNATRSIVFEIGMGNHKEGGIRKIQMAVERHLIDKCGFFCLIDKPDKWCLWAEYNSRCLVTAGPTVLSN